MKTYKKATLTFKDSSTPGEKMSTTTRFLLISAFLIAVTSAICAYRIIFFEGNPVSHFLFLPILFIILWWIRRTTNELVIDKQALTERCKELTCLFGIAKVIGDPDGSLSEILQSIVEYLPPAFQYPNYASARITLDDRIFETPNCKPQVKRLGIDIIIQGQSRGTIEIFYNDVTKNLPKVSFLKEELNLLQTIANQLAPIIVKKEDEEEKMKLQGQLRHADRLATIGQLAAGVAHELNEPLGNILGFAQLAQKTENLSTQVFKDLESIVTASLHAREVIKKLMLFSRQMPPQEARVNLNRLIEEGLYFIESRCAKSGIEMIRLLGSNVPEIIADPSQLYQVIVNLVVNAEQAIPRGGRITIETTADTKFLYLTIKDTGIGMSHEIMAHIFVPFFTTKDVNQGTGLGLAVVHGIVTAHGGTISVESEPNRGTTFTVKLPLTKDTKDSKSQEVN